MLEFKKPDSRPTPSIAARLKREIKFQKKKITSEFFDVTERFNKLSNKTIINRKKKRIINTNMFNTFTQIADEKCKMKENLNEMLAFYQECEEAVSQFEQRRSISQEQFNLLIQLKNKIPDVNLEKSLASFLREPALYQVSSYDELVELLENICKDTEIALQNSNQYIYSVNPFTTPPEEINAWLSESDLLGKLVRIYQSRIETVHSLKNEEHISQEQFDELKELEPSIDGLSMLLDEANQVRSLHSITNCPF